MDEQDFRQALRDGMAMVTTPTMNESVVLDAARRDVRRRRAMWGSGASALAVVTLATGLAAAAPGVDQPGTGAGAEVAMTGRPGDTRPNWPDGQTDATASSGPHYERGLDLLDQLYEVVPRGYDSPPDLTGKGVRNTPLRFHQAEWLEGDSWKYDATIPLVKADRVGLLSVSVFAPDPAYVDGTPCAVSIAALDPGIRMPEGTDPNTDESCSEIAVAGQQVGVATKPGKMLVAYQRPEGPQVVISQEVLAADYGYPGLTELPFTDQQLADLAADPRFHLD